MQHEKKNRELRKNSNFKYEINEIKYLFDLRNKIFLYENLSLLKGGLFALYVFFEISKF